MTVQAPFQPHDSGPASSAETRRKDLHAFLQAISDAAATATAGIANPGRLQLSKLHPDHGRLAIVGRYAIGEVDRMARDAGIEAENGFNVFIEGRTVADHVSGGQRGDGANGTRCVFALVVDNDADKGKATAVVGSPSLIVESSPGNSHVWYFLTLAAAYTEAAAIGARMRTAGGDSATGKPDQPYRVAGTLNFPNMRKRDRGRTVTATAILQASGVRFSRDEFARLWPDSNRGECTARASLAANDHNVDALLARCSPVRRGQLADQDVADRSGHFFKVTGWLKGDGFMPDEALALWRAHPTGSGVAKWGVGEKLGTELSRAWARLKDLPRDERPPKKEPLRCIQSREHDTGVCDDLITEDSVALRFAALYRDRLRYCHDTAAWFEWTGTVWKQNKTGVAFAWARKLARDLSRSEPDKLRFVTSKTSFANGVERYSRTDETFAVTMDAWDADPFLLGTPEGTVDLRTGRLRAGDPAEGITKQCAVAPAETTDCPRWLAFLDEATSEDTQLIRCLQQWAGYSLTGDTREHALVFVYGPGGNGKSVFLNALTGIMGDYAATAAMDTFTASKSDKHPTDLALLRGARLVTASETEEGRAWAESRIKQMTGGDPLTARFMRQDFFTYKPQFKLTIIGNHKPVLNNVDDAARRRFNIVPFTVKPANPDRELEAKLREESPGILRWMIEGCLDWQRNGLIRPESVAAATDEYFSDQDLFGQWLDDECDAEPGNEYKWEASARLFESWADYARAAGEDAGSKKAFAETMQRRGFVSCRKMSNSMRAFGGLRLRLKDDRRTGEDG